MYEKHVGGRVPDRGTRAAKIPVFSRKRPIAVSGTQSAEDHRSILVLVKQSVISYARQEWQGWRVLGRDVYEQPRHDVVSLKDGH